MDDRALRRHRALADPSRARILAELAEGPLDTRELARRVGLHVNTVRVHLGALADAGLVEAATAPSRGRGRPRLVYSSTGAEPDDGRRYRLLAEMLTALVARFGPDAAEQLVEIGEAWGRHMVEAPAPFSELSDSEAVGRLIALLAVIGFEPTLKKQRIEMRPCP
ncbi:MAG TPA: helix-turn-helix domain-containing protein, partial [Gaiellaceae bacterium]